MSMRIDRKLLCAAKLAVPLVAAGLLAACSSTQPVAFEDTFSPQMPGQRYPIDVARGTVKLDVSTASARLTAAQEDAVTRFAQQAQQLDFGLCRGASTGRECERRRGGRSHRPDPEPIRASHAENQIQTTYRGGRGAPVMVAFQRSFATTQECGDWSEEVARTGLNEPYPNFGCAQQNNIAALVANPEDFNHPRAQTPSDSMRRVQVFTDYRKPQPTSTPVDQQSEVKVSQVK